jgi:hypothetical protein
MTLPVSSYEELLARVRSLTHETIQLQRELTTPLVDHNENGERSTVECRGKERQQLFLQATAEMYTKRYDLCVYRHVGCGVACLRGFS